MNDLYIHQIETENKQLRIALQECRKALEEEITTKRKAIDYINKRMIHEGEYYFRKAKHFRNTEYGKDLLEILGDKENENIK